MDTGMLFHGLQYQWTVETEPGETAARDREVDGSYRLELNLNISMPRPATTLADLAVVNPRLPQLLPSLPELLRTARVSPDFAKLYQLKLDWLKRRLEKLEQILSRHNFYDCDTILQLEHAPTGRRALLLQGDMDVNVDGSDGDRNFEVDGSGRFFQPQTAYRWPKTTKRPSSFLLSLGERLDATEKELANSQTSKKQRQELTDRMKELKREQSELRPWSFLISGADPSIALPGFVMRGSGPDVPKAGDYAVVIHGDKMYPAVVGDAGPSYKMGEASLRLCREINDTGTPLARPVSDLSVTYLVFPGSAEAKRQPPDLSLWRDRCADLLEELGVPSGPLHSWENIVPPWPTPTPTPSPEMLPVEAGAAAPASPTDTPES